MPKYKLLTSGRILVVFMIVTLFLQLPAIAQESLTHPASEVTTTAKFYNYRYNISPTNFKDIRYVLVRSSSNEIKCAFNACDVCYPANKGYSQSSTKLRCNNCGKSFDIDALGSQPPGGCWPSNLVSNVNGDDVVIQIADLIKGEYLFPAQTVSDITDNDHPGIKISRSGNSALLINTSSGKTDFIRVFSIDGVLCSNYPSITNEMSIDISEYASGTYLLLISHDSAPLTFLFNILR